MTEIEQFVLEHGIQNPTYLGDGAYAGFDSYGSLYVFAPREYTVHYVVLGRPEYTQLSQYVTNEQERAKSVST